MPLLRRSWQCTPAGSLVLLRLGLSMLGLLPQRWRLLLLLLMAVV